MWRLSTSHSATVNMKRQHIIDEIKRTAAANGGAPLGVARFLRETGIKVTDWEGRFWVRWGDALREAGFEANQFNAAYDKTMLIENFVSLVRELGKFPVRRELQLKARTDRGFPSANVFARLGTKQQLAKEIQEYCKSRDGYDDVIAICEPIVTAETPAEGEVESDEALGFVYLMKSGRFYKIGRSNAAGRREYELAIQMPEKLSTVHSIRTDDPPGIEAYWHKRFETKRKNGEWFELASDDVLAFKRRKFM
jgi:hypothetical protein